MSQQVKFLAGFKSDLLSKYGEGTLTPGALYFCTDEKKIYRATANNAYAAVNEEVFAADDLPEVSSAFLGKLYLRQSDMTLHVLNKDKTAFKQLSAPADALVPGDVTDNLEDNSKLLASRVAVKKVADDLAAEITKRGLDDAQTLADAKKYADKLAGNYSGVDGENNPIQASGLRKEIEDEIKRAQSAEKGLADRLDVIEGTGKGSIAEAVAAEAKLREDADKALTKNITDEITNRTNADNALSERIAAFEEGGANSVTSKIEEVQNQIDDIKDTVGHEAVPGSDGQEAQAASGLFAKIDEEKTRAEGKEAEIKGLLNNEVSRATAAEQANAKAIADEQTRAEAAEQANADAIAANKVVLDKLDGDENVDGSVKKQIKAEADAREAKDNELQGAINTINEALGLGEGVTGGISDKLNTVTGKVNTLEGKVSTLEGKASALETAVGTPAGADPETQPATGLYGDIDALKAKDAELQTKDTELQASINTLNGGIEVDGSVAKAVDDEAKLRKAADDALDARLDVVEASIKDDGSLGSRVKANEDKLKVIQGEGEGSIKKAVADLVNGAPEALDTLKELADALGNNANFSATVAEEIGKKADKTYVDGEIAKITTGEGSIAAELEAVKAKNTEQDTAIAQAQAQADKGVADAAAEATRAQAKELELQNSINAINDETTGILAQAKAYADQKDEELHATISDEIDADVEVEKERAEAAELELRTAVGKKVEQSDYNAKVAELEQADTANLEAAKTDATNKDNTLRTELQGYADSAVEVEKNRAEAEEGKLTTAVNSKVDQSAYNTKIAALEKADTDNLAAANGYTDTEVKKVSDKVGDLNTLETTVRTSAVSAINELKGDIDDINDALGLGGATEGTSIKDRLDSLEGVVGNSEKGLVKDVATNTGNITANAAAIAENATNISNNADAIATINGGEDVDGSIAKALKDAKAYTDGKIGTPSVPGEGEAQGTAAEGLYKVIEDGDADALADAKEYVDTEIGEASKPGEADKPGTPATGLHKVIEDGDTAAKEYADNVANTAVTEALTWGSF